MLVLIEGKKHKVQSQNHFHCDTEVHHCPTGQLACFHNNTHTFWWEIRLAWRWARYETCLKFSSPVREANFFTKIRACWIGCFIKYAAGFNRQNNPVSGLNQRLTCTIWLVLSPPGRYLRLLASSRCMHRYPSRNVWTQMYLMTLLGKKKAKQINTYLSIFRFNGSSLVREPGKKTWCIQKKSGLNTSENWNKNYLRNN